MVGPRLPEASDFIWQSLLFPHNSTFLGLFVPPFSVPKTYFSARERNTAGHETRGEPGNVSDVEGRKKNLIICAWVDSALAPTHLDG